MVPLKTPIKYKIDKTAAAIKRTSLSVLPIFFFISEILNPLGRSLSQLFVFSFALSNAAANYLILRTHRL